MKMTRTATITAGLSLTGVVLLGSAVLAYRAFNGEDGTPARGERPRKAEVKRVINGHKIKLESDEELIYAGIRAPYPQEPLFEEAKRRNIKLVEGRMIRVRFDRRERDRKDRLLAYVSADGIFVNEALVREGLAYVRLTPETRRYADELLAAQAEARQQERGLWQRHVKNARDGYAADPKYGNFHKLSCGEVVKMKTERRVSFKARDDALDGGFAPCTKCRP
jgi:micrococcal nuclease